MWAAPPQILPRPSPITTPQLPLRRRLHISRRRQEVATLRFKPTSKSDQDSLDEDEEDKKQQLSGAEVLIALERRAKSKKSNKRRPLTKRKGENQQGNFDGDDDDLSDDVKPLSIKPEWAQRLQDLETRLQLLIHTE